MSGTTLQERRILNDAIESSYIECARLSAAIRTHKQTGRGTIIDLFEQFHYNLGILVDITADLEEMNSNHEVSCKIESWLEDPAGRVEYIKRCDEGMAAFKEYKKALNNCGLIALPARGK